MGAVMSWTRSGAAVVGALVVVVLLGVFVLVTELPGSSTRPTVTLANRSIDGVRKRQIADLADATYDDGWETCLAAGLTSLAHRLGVTHPSPTTVARAYSTGFDPAFRGGPYLGCRDALRAGQGGSGGQR